MPQKGARVKAKLEGARAERRNDKEAASGAGAGAGATTTQDADSSTDAASTEAAQTSHGLPENSDEETEGDTEGFQDAEGGEDAGGYEQVSEAKEQGVPDQLEDSPVSNDPGGADDDAGQDGAPAPQKEPSFDAPASKDPNDARRQVSAYPIPAACNTKNEDSIQGHDNQPNSETTETTPSLPLKDLPQVLENTNVPPAVPAQVSPPSPPSPPLPLSQRLKTELIDKTPPTSAELRKRSQSSLWNRLRMPAERAVASSASLSSPSKGGAAADPQAPPQPPPRRPSFKPSPTSLFSSITSAANFAANSAASRGFGLPERLGGGAAVAASLAPPPAERKRLPRHEVDEAKMMEDQMRFAEARHLLSTSKDAETIRTLGKDLEAGWRDKLAEVTELHVKLEDLAASVSDVQDENEQLRVQLASLSEQIALREEDFEGFQRLTVAHQQRERELWQQESVEEKERLEWREREAVRILAEERAINAQLRLVLLDSLKDQLGASSSARDGGSLTGLTGQRRWSILPPGGGDGTVTPPGRQEGSSRDTTLFDNVTECEGPSSTQELSRGLQRQSNNGTEGGTNDGEEYIQDDVLFNLNLPHAASNDGPHPSTTTVGHPITSLVTDVVPLDQLRLLLRLDGSASEQQLSAILPNVATGHVTSSHNGVIRSSRNDSVGYQSTRPSTSSPVSTDQSSIDNGSTAIAGTSPLIVDPCVPLNQLHSHLLASKSIADFQLSQSLQLENLSLRSRLKDEQKSNAALQQDVNMLRDKVQGMEEAVSGLLEDQNQHQQTGSLTAGSANADSSTPAPMAS